MFSPQGVKAPVLFCGSEPHGLKPPSSAAPYRSAGSAAPPKTDSALFLGRIVRRRPGQSVHGAGFHPNLLSEEEVGGDEKGEYDRNDAVHGEEGSVETREVVGLDQGMFVEQKQRDGDDAGHSEFSQGEGEQECEEKNQHDEMKGARDPEGGTDSDVARDGVQAGGAVEFKVLAGVEDIEAGDPEGDGGGEEQDARVEGAADGDPCGGGCDAERETQHKMGETGETFGVGVEQ